MLYHAEFERSNLDDVAISRRTQKMGNAAAPPFGMGLYPSGKGLRPLLGTYWPPKTPLHLCVTALNLIVLRQWVGEMRVSPLPPRGFSWNWVTPNGFQREKVDDIFSRFDTIDECDGQTNGHRPTVVPRLHVHIALCRRNRVDVLSRYVLPAFCDVWTCLWLHACAKIKWHRWLWFTCTATWTWIVSQTPSPNCTQGDWSWTAKLYRCMTVIYIYIFIHHRDGSTVYITKT